VVLDKKIWNFFDSAGTTKIDDFVYNLLTNELCVLLLSMQINCMCYSSLSVFIDVGFRVDVTANLVKHL